MIVDSQYGCFSGKNYDQGHSANTTLQVIISISLTSHNNTRTHISTVTPLYKLYNSNGYSFRRKTLRVIQTVHTHNHTSGYEFPPTEI